MGGECRGGLRMEKSEGKVGDGRRESERGGVLSSWKLILSGKHKIISNLQNYI